MAKDHDQVPLAFWVTVPTEAVRVTVSAPGSLQLPKAVAVPPSLTSVCIVVGDPPASKATSAALSTPWKTRMRSTEPLADSAPPVALSSSKNVRRLLWATAAPEAAPE